jgi:tetratricopeptide (TPR) repeat protein
LKIPHLFLFLSLANACACRQKHAVSPLITSSDYEKGESLLGVKDNSAFYYFNKVVSGSKDSLQIAMAYSNMAVIQTDAGDYFGSQESLLTSLKYLNEEQEEDHSCLLSDYNELGTTSLNLKNYDAAMGYYDQALHFVKDAEIKPIALNNKATVYHKKGQYAQAIAIYLSIIDQCKNNKREYARILSNLAKARWQQNPGYVAAPEMLRALQIRKNEKDDWGLNGSYAHLSDYYFRSHPDSALIYAGKMYAIAQQLNSPDDEREALQKLILLSPERTLRQYFIRYYTLSDSIQKSRNAARNQFALIRYEAEKNKTDKLRLQKENTEKRIQILRQRVIIYAVIAFLIAASIIAIIWDRKRKQRIMWESENTIRENDLKNSQKVHDVVANGLYRIMTGVEHQDVIDKDAMLDEIEILYEKSRDISYEQSTYYRHDFHGFIAKLLTGFKSNATKVVIAGNHELLWRDVKDPVKNELEHILQELMVNMKKHSHAQNVAVRFERDGGQVKIQYIDDGVGLPSQFHSGNGLTNTGNRIQNLGGRIIFDKSTTRGLKIDIFLPII